jgi:hypothetical protein
MGSPHSRAEQTYERLSPFRHLGEPPVLLALAAIVLGAVSLGLLLAPRSPENDSVEAGFARDMITHHAQAV